MFLRAWVFALNASGDAGTPAAVADPPLPRDLSPVLSLSPACPRLYPVSAQYTLLDFLPKFLMEEFHPRRKMANAYFLVLASLQTIPAITNTFGVPTILLPLSIVIIVDAFFAIIEVSDPLGSWERRRGECELELWSLVCPCVSVFGVENPSGTSLQGCVL